MALTAPTLSELQDMRAGLYFDATTAPTATKAQDILDSYVDAANSIMLQIGLSQEEIADLDPTENLELQSWFRRIVLYGAMADVWEILPGTTSNPWRERYNDLKDKALRQPEAVGMPLPEDRSAAPTVSDPVENQIFGGKFNSYLRFGNGF
jgi:hypothetical protein